MTSDAWLEDELETLEHCPICGSSKAEVLYKDQRDITFNSAGGPWTLERCPRCTCAYLNPRPTRQSIGKAYQTYYTHAPRTDWLARFPVRLRETLLALRNGFYRARYGHQLEPSSPLGAWLIPCVPWLEYRFELDIRQVAVPPANGVLLDVGCGNGDYLETMRGLGWRALGIEPDPKAAELAQRKGLDVQIGTLETLHLASEQFDVITLSHVIEHVHDPMATLREAWHLLKPGGTIWIATPNLDSFGHQRYSAAWRGLEIPRHLVLFSTRHLRQCLTQAGFECLPLGRQALVAQNLFRISHSLALGAGIIRTPTLPLPDRLQAIYADLHSIFFATRAEYASVIGRKP